MAPHVRRSLHPTAAHPSTHAALASATDRHDDALRASGRPRSAREPRFRRIPAAPSAACPITPKGNACAMQGRAGTSRACPCHRIARVLGTRAARAAVNDRRSTVNDGERRGNLARNESKLTSGPSVKVSSNERAERRFFCSVPPSLLRSARSVALLARGTRRLGPTRDSLPGRKVSRYGRAHDSSSRHPPRRRRAVPRRRLLGGRRHVELELRRIELRWIERQEQLVEQHLERLVVDVEVQLQAQRGLLPVPVGERRQHVREGRTDRGGLHERGRRLLRRLNREAAARGAIARGPSARGARRTPPCLPRARA